MAVKQSGGLGSQALALKRFGVAVTCHFCSQPVCHPELDPGLA